jgi:hypothetical protein
MQNFTSSVQFLLFNDDFIKLHFVKETVRICTECILEAS